MTKQTLLPPNATALETAFSRSQSDLFTLRHQLQTLIDPVSCPASFLPYLAWAWSVDYWDWTWPEAQKRRVVASSRFVHQHKGTRAAVQRVVNDLGFDIISLDEWWQTHHPAGTWSLHLAVTDQGIGINTHSQLLRQIAGAQTRSRPLHLTISLSNRSQIPTLASTTLAGEAATIYPKALRDLAQAESVYFCATSYSVETLTTYPRRVHHLARAHALPIGIAHHSRERVTLHPKQRTS